MGQRGHLVTILPFTLTEIQSPLAPAVPVPIMPHLSAALALSNNGTFQFWQQGTLDEVAQSVEVILGTQMGSRSVVPTFGIPDPTFTDPNPYALTTVVHQWDNRAKVDISVAVNNDGVANVAVNVALAQGANQP